MSELLPYTSPSLLQRATERALGRQLTSIERTKCLAIARTEAQAQVEATRVHAVGYVGQQAMHAVAIVSQMEGQLGTMCPLAVTRLQGVADMTALGIVQVVATANRRLS